MLRLTRFASVVLASCVAATASPAAPPPVAPDRPAPPAAEVRAPQSLHARSVLGSKVSIQGGLAIGSVEDIIFGDDGYIDYLVVLNEGKYVTVPWEAAKFDFEKKTATVEITQDRYREIPTYTTETLPSVRYYEPAYREKIYGYYGVKPRREIRIEKRP